MIEFKFEEPDIQVPGDPKTLMQVFGLSMLEAQFFRAMLSSKDWVGPEELPAVKYSKRQVIYTMRQKLEPKQIMVMNNGNGRYAVTPTGKRIVKRMIEDVLSEFAHGE